MRKPALIKNLFRFAGTEKMPGPINKNLHPGVVIVTMRPPGYIDLTGRNPHAAKRGYGKYGFFSAAALSQTVHRHRRDGAVVTGAVASVFRAPVIYFKGGFHGRKPFDAGIKLRKEKGAAVLNGFGIYPVAEDVVKEDFLGNIP